MKEEYVSKDEYDTLFVTLTREQVAGDIKVGVKVLDIAAGSAYFTIQVAMRNPDSSFTAVDIYQGSVDEAKKNIEKAGLETRINAVQMDSSCLDFPDEAFDTVINYLGLENIHMTRGMEGVEKTFQEVYRVLKPGGGFYFVAMPQDEMESIPQRIEVDVFDWICGAKWLETSQYLELAREVGFSYQSKHSYYTGKKLTTEQAREEIEYACLNVPVNYGVETRSFDETWRRFGAIIKAHGMGHYSKTALFELVKPS